jgi:hypothetical protein
MYCAPNGTLWGYSVINMTYANTSEITNGSVEVINGSAMVPIQVGDVFSKHWAITPFDITYNCTRHHCASPRATLNAFAIANILESLFALVLGAAPVVRWLTKNRFGTYKPEAFLYSWVFPAVLLILGNTFTGLVIRGTAGYEHISVADVLGIYLVRPRISWILASLFACVKPEYWLNAAISNSIAEVFTQIGATAFLFRTWPDMTKRVWGQSNSMIWVFVLILGCTLLSAVNVAIIVALLRRESGRVFIPFVLLLSAPSYAFSWVFFNIFMRNAAYL